MFLLKLLWALLKYVGAPIIPFALLIELRNVPTVGIAACNAACIALVLYSLIALGVHAARRARPRTGKAPNGWSPRPPKG